MLAIPSVLVVDDNPDTLETLVALIRSLGVEIVEAACSAEIASEMLETQQFSLLVVDYRLEGMDGVEFVEQLRASGNPTPVILLSGAPDKNGVIRATSHPKVDFFAKPFRVVDLMMAMERVAA